MGFLEQKGHADSTKPIAVIGAGTGLGQVFMTPSADSGLYEVNYSSVHVLSVSVLGLFAFASSDPLGSMVDTRVMDGPLPF